MYKIRSEIIKNIGLPEMQGKVYLAALELGKGTIQAIARKSGVNRSTIYTFIEDLKQQGYITEIKKGSRKLYSALSPEKVLEREKIRVEQLESFIPELIAIDNAVESRPKVTFHAGIEGIEELYKDILQDKNVVFAYEDIDALKENLPENTFDWFPAARVKNGVAIKSISRDTEYARTFSKDNIKLLRETKFLKSKEFGTDINIYGNKVGLINLEEHNMFAVLIENENIAETMRVAWEELWKRL